MSLLLSVHLSVFCASFSWLLCSFCNVVGSVVVAMVLVVACWCGSPFIQPSQHWKQSLAMSEGLYSCLIQSHADTFPHATHIHCHCHRHTLWYHCTWLFWPGCVCSWLCCVWGCLLVRFSVFRPIVTFRLTFFYLSLSTYPSLMFQLTEQAAHFAVISEKLEKEIREKAELSAQLMELKGQLRACDREVTIVSWSCH